METLTLDQAAQRAGVSASTLRRWVREGVVPLQNGRWTPVAASQARMVARMRERGHTLDELRQAVSEGRLAFGFVEDLFPASEGGTTLEQAAERTGLEPALIQRLWGAVGFPPPAGVGFTEEDVQALQYIAAVLDAGFPLVAFLQLCRVYGQSLQRMADAEARLTHLYVHEPLMQEGVPELQIAEEMEHLVAAVLPLASPLMDFVHQRFLTHFVEQDVVGHMEAGLAGADLGRVRVAIAFADLTGFTNFIEEAGEEEALESVERFIEAVEVTLPEEARVVKTIGDEVMVVGNDPAALAYWAVGFQSWFRDRPQPRVGIHYGAALYRDGDYYGWDVNLAARVVARARASEVLVSQAVRDALGDRPELEFEPIGAVRLKGFAEPMPLFLARRLPEVAAPTIAP